MIFTPGLRVSIRVLYAMHASAIRSYFSHYLQNVDYVNVLEATFSRLNRYIGNQFVEKFMHCLPKIGRQWIKFSINCFSPLSSMSLPDQTSPSG